MPTFRTSKGPDSNLARYGTDWAGGREALETRAQDFSKYLNYVNKKEQLIFSRMYLTDWTIFLGLLDRNSAILLNNLIYTINSVL